MPLSKKIKTFTLIEMLIVIVIIGILAAALVPRLQNVQGRSRDTKRKTDLRTIYNANEIYKMDVGRYSPMNGCAYDATCYTHSTATQPWIAGLSGLLTSIPTDPVNNTAGPWTTGNYSYTYGNVTTTHIYDLITQLENTKDPERCGIKNYEGVVAGDRCGGNSPMLYQMSPQSNPYK